MGKRRSKTAKQKQAKARQKNGKKTSLGGVAVSKGMTSKFQQQTKSSSVISLQMSNKNVANVANGKKITEASLRQKLKTKTKKVFLPTPSKAAEAPGGRNNSNNKKTSKHDEQTEFRRQMASLQERQMAVGAQKKKSSKTGTNNSTLSFGFQEASFSLSKTPQQMLQETTRQMETMTGVGQQGIGSFSSTPIRTNQSWAVASAKEEASSPLGHKNPFDALGGNDWDDDDDNNDWSATDRREPKQETAGLLSMAPPTFSLLPRITPTPATSPHPNRFGEEEEEIDPDL